MRKGSSVAAPTPPTCPSGTGAFLLGIYNFLPCYTPTNPQDSTIVVLHLPRFSWKERHGFLAHTTTVPIAFFPHLFPDIVYRLIPSIPPDYTAMDIVCGDNRLEPCMCLLWTILHRPSHSSTPPARFFFPYHTYPPFTIASPPTPFSCALVLTG